MLTHVCLSCIWSFVIGCKYVGDSIVRIRCVCQMLTVTMMLQQTQKKAVVDSKLCPSTQPTVSRPTCWSIVEQNWLD